MSSVDENSNSTVEVTSFNRTLDDIETRLTYEGPAKQGGSKLNDQISRPNGGINFIQNASKSLKIDEFNLWQRRTDDENVLFPGDSDANTPEKEYLEKLISS